MVYIAMRSVTETPGGGEEQRFPAQMCGVKNLDLMGLLAKHLADAAE